MLYNIETSYYKILPDQYLPNLPQFQLYKNPGYLEYAKVQIQNYPNIAYFF